MTIPWGFTKEFSGNTFLAICSDFGMDISSEHFSMKISKKSRNVDGNSFLMWDPFSGFYLGIQRNTFWPYADFGKDIISIHFHVKTSKMS